MQIKGAGKTPFCRGADGRAVIRSSVREFLASEAMHHLGVGTTRALSLVASGSETVQRAWYSDEQQDMPSLDDPRLAQFPMALRKQLLAQRAQQVKQPDVLVEEQCANTCRLSPSFIRIGQIELFGRRAAKGDTTALRQLEAIVRHALSRECPEVDTKGPIEDAALALLRFSSERVSTLTTEWLRVGFGQGNFNSDNCLVGGRTMDYGPFGFMQDFEPLWNMWAGSGDHFGFLNQPTAGGQNVKSLYEALEPILGANKSTAQAELQQYRVVAKAKQDAVWGSKLGLRNYLEQDGPQLMKELFAVLERHKGDYTIWWRQLATVLESCSTGSGDADLFAAVARAFPDSARSQVEVAQWLRKWIAVVEVEGAPRADVSASMKKASPKYVPREWMLVDAYAAAKMGNYDLVHELHRLFEHPYDEQPEYHDKYYVRVPDTTLNRGGTGFMT